MALSLNLCGPFSRVVRDRPTAESKYVLMHLSGSPATAILSWQRRIRFAESQRQHHRAEAGSEPETKAKHRHLRSFLGLNLMSVERMQPSPFAQLSDMQRGLGRGTGAGP